MYPCLRAAKTFPTDVYTVSCPEELRRWRPALEGLLLFLQQSDVSFAGVEITPPHIFLSPLVGRVKGL